MSFIVRRLIFYVVAAWVALTINFIIPRLVPGNAVESIMAKFPNLQPAAYRAIEAMLGVGHPGSIWHQYWAYLVDVSHLNLHYPWLATSYAWSNGDKTITFTIRQGVKWNNGTPLTPADVAFTFEMVKKNASINSGGLNISSVSTSGNTVTLTFPTSQYTNLEEIAGQAIVPKSQWSGVNPATFTDATPVGTGPSMLGSFTPQGFTLKKNPNYWQASLVKVPNVYFPVYTSNTGALSALFNNQIDWTGNYIPGLQKDFVATDPAHHNYWEAAGGDESLEPNLTKWPTNQPAVRQAMSLAVNRTLLASEGEAGLASPITESGGLTLPTFQAWAGPVTSQTMPTTSNTAAAEQVLQKAGFTEGKQRLLPEGRQDRLADDHQPDRVHRHVSGRRHRRPGTEGGRDRRDVPGPVRGRLER